MRGKHQVTGQASRVHGLIPAHAGKTLSISLVRTGSRAHPRACGENATNFNETQFSCGSSPRMRGKLFAAFHRANASRLIPAHAGKTTPHVDW